ncbi:MAG: carboxylate-amine ligase [Gammaproteobacteria bacterium]|nr:carboxylate-amine ligase [Gammaproteobacteria bacterium]
MPEPAFTIGMEEEYLLVDKVTRDLATDPPAEMMKEAQSRLEGQVAPEFLRAQIEVGTRVCNNVQEARRELARLRRGIAEVADNYGLAPIAASTHPFAVWYQQKHTDKERYDALTKEMQAAARRLLICGMHVHVGIADNDLRIDLLNQFAYFLPHLLALSCSSPFWEGQNTGLKSYRLTVFDALPRTGLPERFASYREYERHLEIMKDAGILDDPTKIWWDMRLSARYPTLESRITDICTRLDDAVALAAMTVCILSMLWRLRRNNQRWREYANMLIMENRWRAMRYSFDEGLVDFGKGKVVPHDQMLDELIELIHEDAVSRDCVREIESLRGILSRGTSAHRQVAVFEKAKSDGASHREALNAVVDFLIAETQLGI